MKREKGWPRAGARVGGESDRARRADWCETSAHSRVQWRGLMRCELGDLDGIADLEFARSRRSSFADHRRFCAREPRRPGLAATRSRSCARDLQSGHRRYRVGRRGPRHGPRPSPAGPSTTSAVGTSCWTSSRAFGDSRRHMAGAARRHRASVRSADAHLARAHRRVRRRDGAGVAARARDRGSAGARASLVACALLGFARRRPLGPVLPRGLVSGHPSTAIFSLPQSQRHRSDRLRRSDVDLAERLLDNVDTAAERDRLSALMAQATIAEARRRRRARSPRRLQDGTRSAAGSSTR